MRRRFRSERSRLRWLVKSVGGRLSGELLPGGLFEAAPEAFVVCTIWLRRAVSFAEGAERLLRSDLVEAVSPIKRSMYELWLDHRYLLRVGSPEESARKVFINAAMEMRDLFVKESNQFDDNMRAAGTRILENYRNAWPREFELVKSQRGERCFHWSGLSRSRIERTLDHGAILYKHLSWDAHSTLTPIRDFAIVEGGNGSTEFQFEAFRSDGEEEWLSYSVGGILFFMWNEYAKHFEQAPIQT